jgi:carbonic anhydrase
MLSAFEALDHLRDGNRRFVANESIVSNAASSARRAHLASGQAPFAIVLRVGGNIVAPSQIGSVEFAAARFDTRLVVVLGHSQCGVVLATLEELLGRTTTQSMNLRSIVDRVRPSVEKVLSLRHERDPEALMGDAVRANVRAAAHRLRHGSELLENLIRTEGLLVVGAEYSLESGVVTFFDGVPEVSTQSTISNRQSATSGSFD